MRILTIAILSLTIGWSVRAAQPDQKPESQAAAAQQEKSPEIAARVPGGQAPEEQAPKDGAPKDQQTRSAVETTDQAEKDDPDAKQPFGFWMEKKLEYSQDMLKGLAIGDLDLVTTKARQMRVLSRAEGWIRRGKPGYTAQLQAFSFANAEIERHAKAGNLEGAAMGFQQLTISCVSCHSMLRNRN